MPFEQLNIEKMGALPKQFLVDDTGKKVSIVLDIREYQHILEQLEELEDIQLYDEGKKNQKSAIPMDEAFKAIEAQRK